MSVAEIAGLIRLAYMMEKTLNIICQPSGI